MVSPVGNSISEYWRGLSNGNSGVGKITEFDPLKSGCRIAGIVKDYDVDAHFKFREKKRYERFTQFGLVAALQAAEEAFRIAQLRYEEGVADFQTVLTSQNTLFSTRNSYLDNKLLQLNAMIGLFQALGGGWQAE